MQSFEEYRKDFLEDTKATEESEANGTVASFVKICALKLFEADVLPEYTPCYFQGSGHSNASLRVDGYAFNDLDGTFYLLTASYDGGETCATLLGSDAKILLDRCRAFALNSLEYGLAQKIEISTQAYDLASYIDEQQTYISKIVVILLTDMSLSERAVLSDTAPRKGTKNRAPVKKRVSVLSAEAISDFEVEYRIWDMPRFHRIFASGDGHEEVEIDFAQYLDGGIPCLSANTMSESHEFVSYLCTVPGNVIADLYDDYGSHLLEGNVRSFLGRRGVNTDIRNTVLNEPERFFVYNNGLAATATDAMVKDGKLIYAKDLQIVNGGQTTATLSAARRNSGADLSKVFVLMKLTKVEPDLAATMVPLISRSANSQNKINPADFFSTHEYHVRLEKISRRKFAPAKDGAQHETHWFYERARGQYTQATMQMTKGEERKFSTQNPKDQVITKTELAKVLSAWDEFPHLVSKGAETNFGEFAKRIESQWKTKRDDFNDNYFQEAIALVILYKSVDKLIPKQPWYDRGYKANILAYSIAFLHHLISEQYSGATLDLQKIWQKQKCPDALLTQMAVITEAVYNSITGPGRPVENVTQWCKQLACWDRIKELKIVLTEGFEATLCGKQEVTEVICEARQMRKMENTIDAQTTVFELGVEYWVKLHQWLEQHRLATEVEIRALKVAVQMSVGMFPDEKQCKSLLNLRKKAIREGFPETIK